MGPMLAALSNFRDPGSPCAHLRYPHGRGNEAYSLRLSWEPIYEDRDSFHLMIGRSLYPKPYKNTIWGISF